MNTTGWRGTTEYSQKYSKLKEDKQTNPNLPLITPPPRQAARDLKNLN